MGDREHLSLLAATVWDVSAGVGIVVLALAVGGVLAMGWLWRSTAPSRVDAAEPTMELGDETPALVDLLTGGFVVDDDAVPATLVDLAGRGHVEIDELGGEVVLRPRSTGGRRGDDLTPYERRVLTHVEQHTVNGSAPAAVLTTGPEGVSERWFKSFVGEVNRHGQTLGLCRRRFDLEHLAAAWAIVVIGGGPAWVVARAGRRTTDPTGWATLGNVLVGLALLVSAALAWLAVLVSKSNRQTDTPAGREAAARWLGVRDHLRSVGEFEEKPAASVAIWDRYLAYATAMGLAPTVERQLPFAAEHDRRAWSRATGRWRRVKIRYQAFVPQWGQSPGKVAFEGLVQAAFAGLLAYGAFLVSRDEFDLATLTDEQQRWVSFGAFVVTVLAAAVFVYCVAKVVLGVSDLFARRTIEGEVVRARALKTGHRLPKVVQWALYAGRDDQGQPRDWNRRERHHLAIDVGDDDSIVAHVVREQIYRQVRQGARVRAVVTPRLGYVRSVETVAPPRRSAASAPVVQHELVEEATGKVADRISGSLHQAFANLEHATDADGNSVLDQVDEEGVTVRERLRQSNDQLAALRDDPRLKNSPIAGFLDAFLDSADGDSKPGSRGRSDG